MRPHQWTKNLLLFAGVLFSKHLFDLEKLFIASGAFVVFCLVAGGIYIFNDLIDLEQDRRHPLKRGRPLASGLLKPSVALIGSGLALAIGLWGAFRLSFSFGGMVSIYLAQNLLYTKFLKYRARRMMGKACKNHHRMPVVHPVFAEFIGPDCRRDGLRWKILGNKQDIHADLFSKRQRCCLAPFSYIRK